MSGDDEPSPPSRAPWTPGEVAALAEWQACEWVHPFTCGHCRDTLGVDGGQQRKLVPTLNGWVCPTCDYRQGWCHQFMLKGAPPSPWPVTVDIPVPPIVLHYAVAGAAAGGVEGATIAASICQVHGAALAAAGLLDSSISAVRDRLYYDDEDHPEDTLLAIALKHLTVVRDRAVNDG